MAAALLFTTAVLLAGAGAAGGSMIGHAFGPAGLVAGALLGGAAGVVAAAGLARWRGWIAPRAFGATAAAGLVGFAAAAAMAWTHADGPVIPVLSTLLVGAGAVAGRRVCAAPLPGPPE